MLRAVVFGAGGFIGSHLVSRLKDEGYFVKGVDLKFPEFNETAADEFVVADLRNEGVVQATIKDMDEVYQLAADMGGAGYVFTSENDAEIMLNSAQINLNTAKHAHKVGKVFFSSSACVYPEFNQKDPDNPVTSEDTAYPAHPDSNYGWEKLFAERLYDAIVRNRGADIRVFRFHNVYGPYGTYKGGREKAPAAICRKVVEAITNKEEHITIWGDGKQTRSFMYIDDCIKGIRKLMEMERAVSYPLNLGSEEMVTIKALAETIILISGYAIAIKYEQGRPIGVRGRNSDNHLLRNNLHWEPTITLMEGLVKTYKWVNWEMTHEQAYLR